MAKTRLLGIAIGGQRSGSFAGKEEVTAISAEAKQYVGFTHSVGKLINN